MCALPGPLSDCVSEAQTSHCSSSSSPFIHPALPPATGLLRWGAAAGLRGGQGGRPFDFKDIDRHFSIVQKALNSFDERRRPILPPPPRRPAQHQLK